MNDDIFFSKFCQSPRLEFTQSLYARLAQDSKAGSFVQRGFIAKQLVLTLVALTLAFALMLAVSPAARAAMINIIEMIIVRGTTVWVSDDVPALKGESETYSEIWTPVNPADLASDYPDFAKLPTWVPSGYLLQERAALFGSMTLDRIDSVLVEWKDKHDGILQLNISKGACPNGQLWESGEPRSDCAYGWYINADLQNKPEVLTINNQPAILFPNFLILMDLSDPIKRWNPYRIKFDNRDPAAYFLIFESDGMRFEITTRSWTISKEDLIRLAESIP